MTPYAVIRVEENKRHYYNWRTRSRGEPEDNAEMAVQWQENVSAGTVLSSERAVYFVSSEEKAKALAAHLAESFPGVEWHAVCVMSVYKAVIERVSKSDFDPKKGLVPGT